MNGDDTPISKFRSSCQLLPTSLPPPVTHQVTSAAGFMGTKQSPMTSMAFHPHHMVLGCSSGDQLDVFQMSRYQEWLAAPGTQMGRFGQ